MACQTLILHLIISKMKGPPQQLGDRFGGPVSEIDCILASWPISAGHSREVGWRVYFIPPTKLS